MILLIFLSHKKVLFFVIDCFGYTVTNNNKISSLCSTSSTRILGTSAFIAASKAFCNIFPSM